MRHAPDFFRSTGSEPLPFTFGLSSPAASAALPALDRINERFVRRARTVVEGLARCRANITAEPVVTRRYTDWQAGQGGSMLASLYAFAPMKGMILLCFSAETLRSLLDRYFGGTAGSVVRRGSELTPSEENFFARLDTALVAALGDAWSRSLVVDASVRSRETNLAYAALVPPDEAVAVCDYRVTLASGSPLAFTILYPVAGLRSVDRQLADPAEEESGDCTIWRADLADALAGVRFDARTVLARPQISLDKLMGLAVGDVLPVTLNAEVPMIVADRTIAMGTMGDAHGCAALQISRILNRKAGQ
jgi:flagellar motor switch protein FliM